MQRGKVYLSRVNAQLQHLIRAINSHYFGNDDSLQTAFVVKQVHKIHLHTRKLSFVLINEIRHSQFT